MAEDFKFESIGDVLDFAIAKEIETYEFYKEWAAKVDNSAIKEALAEFSGEELKHRKLLEDVKAGKHVIAQKTSVPDLKLADYFTMAKPSESMSFQDALRVAIQREKTPDRNEPLPRFAPDQDIQRNLAHLPSPVIR